jgi:hypothetical protein
MPFDIEFQSESRYTVIDPTTTQPYNFYLSSLVNASNEVYYDVYPTYSTASIGWNGGGFSGLANMIWVEYLGKYVTQTDNGPVFRSADGYTWTPVTQIFPVGTFPNQFYVGRKMAVAEDLQIIVSNDIDGFTTKSIFHSMDDGDTWNTGSVSEQWTGYGMAYSPTLQRFVSVGYYTKSGDKASAAYSDNGISFTVISGSNLPSTSSLAYFSDVTWDTSGSGQFIAIAERNGAGIYKTCSVYTSANGISWTLKTDINSSQSFTSYPFSKIAAISGSYLIIGSGIEDIGITPILRSTNLVSWSYASASWRNASGYSDELYDIAHSPSLNRTVIVGQIRPTINTIPVVLVSDDTITWYTSSRFTDTGYYNPSLANIAWSPTLNQFAGLAFSDHVYRSNDGITWLNDNQSYSASIGFEDTPPGTLLNTALSPWTGSATYLTEMENVYTYMTYTLLTTNFNDSYIPTSSYGIIIDSSSMVNFSIDTGIYGTSSFVEVVEIDGIQRIREISQPGGEEIEDTQFVTYRSNSLLPTLVVGATSSFSASLKSEGRNVRFDYFLEGNATKPAGFWTNSPLQLYSSMVLDLTNGEVISASAQPAENFVFLEQPRLTDKTNGYWELTFKAGFGRTLSGSVTITTPPTTTTTTSTTTTTTVPPTTTTTTSTSTTTSTTSTTTTTTAAPLTLTRSSLGRLAAHTTTAISGVTTAFSTSDWVAKSNVTISTSGTTLDFTSVSSNIFRTMPYVSITQSQAFIQGVGRAVSTGGTVGAAVRADSGSTDYDGVWMALPPGFSGPLGVREIENGATIAQDTITTALSTNTDYRFSIYTDSASGSAGHYFGGPGLTATSSYALTLTRGGTGVYSGSIGLIHSRGSAGTTRYSEFYAMSDRYVRVTGLPTSASVQILSGSSTVLTSGSEAAGTATVDMLRVIFPTATNIRVLDSSSNVLITATPTERVWGGDTWVYGV